MMAKDNLKPAIRANQTVNAIFHDSKWRDDKRSEVYDKDGLYRGIPYTHDYRSALREEILAKHTSNQDLPCSDWMRSLAQTSMSVLAASKGTRLKTVEQQAKFDNSTADLIGKIFSILRTYSYEYNQSIGWTELHISSSIPGFVTEVLRYNLLREASETLTYFRARLSTSSFSLVIRGRNHRIEVFLIPVSKSIGLTQSEKDYKPIVSFSSRVEDSAIQWSMDGQPLVEGHMELIAMELFTMLVSASNEKLQGTNVPAIALSPEVDRLSNITKVS
ncbi:MAG: hypothetical protein K2X29_11850 [Candidatus Obscuribacterales bacterium]|nr:hypothetical protein [Candidatus Obscuribacterales bacterium]